MKTVKVNASKAYDILIGEDLLDDSGRLSAAVVAVGKVCIVTDDTVAELYLERTLRSFKEAGFDAISFTIPHGESSKNTASLISLLEFLAENRLTRSDSLVALGGGVVGDLCGFAAAVYLRGISFIQIPTTLLAAVDSSVGGKTAVDLKAGKNLAGAFHQPSLVICDYKTLDTLSPEIFADGCAEVIKYGMINDRKLFDLLKTKGIKPIIKDVIASCVKNKSDIVESDEFDTGKRQLLNLGHTVGHAVEICSELTISHGSAVAIGMVVVTKAAVSMGICQNSDLFELKSLLSAFSLPTECPYSAAELANIATADKKRMGDSISFVVPYGIGDSRLLKINVSDIEDFIKKGI